MLKPFFSKAHVKFEQVSRKISPKWLGFSGIFKDLQKCDKANFSLKGLFYIFMNALFHPGRFLNSFRGKFVIYSLIQDHFNFVSYFLL